MEEPEKKYVIVVQEVKSEPRSEGFGVEGILNVIYWLGALVTFGLCWTGTPKHDVGVFLEISFLSLLWPLFAAYAILFT
jgi:hypothetical protein